MRQDIAPPTCRFTVDEVLDETPKCWIVIHHGDVKGNIPKSNNLRIEETNDFLMQKWLYHRFIFAGGRRY